MPGYTPTFNELNAFRSPSRAFIPSIPTLAPRSNQLAGSPVTSFIGKGLTNLIPGGEIISSVLNIIPAIMQGVQGRKQLRMADQIESENPRPEAVIAPSIEKMGRYAYGQTLAQDIPGGQLYRNEIKGATAAGIRAASELGSGAEAYGMLGELVGRQQGQFSELARITADRVAGKEDAYLNTLGMKSDEENRVWDWNNAQPYLAAAEAAGQLRDSGLRNQNSAVKNVFGSAAEAVAPDFSTSLLWGNDNTRTGKSIDPAELRKMIQEALNS